MGLGSGIMAGYARPGDRWTLYEINSEMMRVAMKRDYFTYLPDCPAECEIVLGDARLSVAKARDEYFDLFAVDAFNSDAIPVHLVTVEALELYLTELAPHGLMLFHITNARLDLAPLFRNLSRSLGLTGIARYHEVQTKQDIRSPIMSSHWVALAQPAGPGVYREDRTMAPPRHGHPALSGHETMDRRLLESCGTPSHTSVIQVSN